MPAPLATTAASPYLNKPLRSLEQAAHDADHRRRVEGPVEQLQGAAGPAEAADAAAFDKPAAGNEEAGGRPTGHGARAVDFMA